MVCFGVESGDLIVEVIERESRVLAYFFGADSFSNLATWSMSNTYHMLIM